MIHAIINPISGAGAQPDTAARRANMVREAATGYGEDVQIHFTERGGHARELAAAAVGAGVQGVIVWGGDGTFNEAAGALIGTNIPVGLVPAGSGNGLAGALGTPRIPQDALRTFFSGDTRKIDAGRIGDRIFFNVAGIGFDARVAALFNQRAAGTRGPWPYFVIGVRQGCTYCALDYDVRLDDEPMKYRALLIVFANGSEYGLGARIAPDARLDDGLLDVLIAEDRGVLARFWSARHFARGAPANAPSVLTRRVRKAVVEAAGEMEFHVDGEPARASGRLEIEVLPGALAIRTP